MIAYNMEEGFCFGYFYDILCYICGVVVVFFLTSQFSVSACLDHLGQNRFSVWEKAGLDAVSCCFGSSRALKDSIGSHPLGHVAFWLLWQVIYLNLRNWCCHALGGMLLDIDFDNFFDSQDVEAYSII